MEEQKISLREKIIKEQDIIVYYIANDQLDFQNRNKYIDYILENNSILDEFYVKNLVTLLSSSKFNKNEELLKNILNKLENDVFFIEEFAIESYELGFEYLSDKVKRIIPLSILAVIEKKTIERENNARKTIKEYIGRDDIFEYFYKSDRENKTLDFCSESNFLRYLEKGIFTKEKLEFLYELVNMDNTLLQHTNFGIFEDEIFSLRKDFIKKVINYPNLCSQIITIKDNNPKLFQLLKLQIGEKENLEENLSEIEILTDFLFKNVYNIELKDVTDEKLSELLDCAILHKQSEKSMLKIIVPYSENFYEQLDQKCDEEYEKTNINISSQYLSNSLKESFSNRKINIYLNKYFAISMDEALSLIDQYGRDLEGIKESNSQINIQYIEQIKKILEIKEPDEIDKLYHSTEIRYRPSEVLNLKKQISMTVAKSYSEPLNETNERLNSQEHIQYIEYYGKKIKQINLTGDFDILIHSTDSGFVSDKLLGEDVNFPELWNKMSNRQNHIASMCYINQDFMGCPPVGNNGVMYGFTNVKYEKIKLMGNTDINTHSYNFGYSAKAPQYITREKMTSQSRRVYSEFALEKEGISPDYVIIFDDSGETVIENTKKAASQFGIPILYIDKREIERQQITNIDNLLNEFQETHDIEIMKKVLNTYETNVAGWLLNRSKKEEDKSFTEGIDNERFREDFEKCYSRISSVLNNYLEQIQDNELSVQGVVDIARMMSIILEERDLYAHTEEVKPISKTSITIDAEGIINKINETLRRIGRSEFIVELDQIPTAEQYNIKIEQLIRNALQGENPINIEDVNLADAAKEHIKQNDKQILQEGQ